MSYFDDASDYKRWSTKDVYIASTAVVLGHKVSTLEKDGGIFYFIFEINSPAEKVFFYSLEDKYWNDEFSVSPKSLFTAIKDLKRRMSSRSPAVNGGGDEN